MKKPDNAKSSIRKVQKCICAGMTTLIPMVMIMSTFNKANAVHFDLENDVSLDLDTTLRYRAGWRTENQNSSLLANINGDDGNRNFDQGDMINNRFDVILEGKITRGDYGAFIRGKAFYDFAYMGDNSNDSPGTVNNGPAFGGPLSSHDEFTGATEDRHGQDIELLDAYAFGTWSPGGKYVNLKVGRQVVSWGESLFISNSISTAQSPLDGTEANIPGVELRDLFLPVGQVYASYEFIPNFTFAGYYQWEWDKTRLDESGAYFSSTDFLDDAGYHAIFAEDVNATMDRTNDDEPDDQGQFGLSLRYLAESLNFTEFGLYYLNYHEKLPLLQSQYSGGVPSPINGLLPAPLNLLDTSSYYLEYPENVKLYGISIGTVVGDINLGLEASYRQDFPVAVASTAAPFGMDYEDADVLQLHANMIALYPEVLFANQWNIYAEVGYNNVSNYDGELVADEDSLGLVFRVQPTFNQILPNLDLEVPVTAKINPYNTSAVQGTFTEDADSYGISLNFTYRTVYQVGLSYTWFVGDYDDNTKTDRDFLGLSLKYAF